MKFSTCNITVFRVNPENFHMEFFDKLNNLTVNGIYDYIRSLRSKSSTVIFDNVITVRNEAICYLIDLEGDSDTLGKFYIKLQKKLKE